MTDSDTPPHAAKPPAAFYPDGSGKSRWWDGNDWTDHYQDDPPATKAPSGPPAQPVEKKRRVFLWVFMAIQVLFIIWIIGGAASGSGTPDDCGSLDADTCNAASDFGTSIGVALVVGLWIVVDFLLALVYGVYRLAKRN